MRTLRLMLVGTVTLALLSGLPALAQEASPEPSVAPSPDVAPAPLESESATEPLPVANYWGEWANHKEASIGRLDLAMSNARNIGAKKKARFYRDAAAVNRDELAWLANHRPRECYATEYEKWRAATDDLHGIHKKAARFAKSGKRAGLRRTLKQQRAAVRRLNAAYSAFSDCPDMFVPPISRPAVSPIVGQWVTARDYVDPDGTHISPRINVEVGRNGNMRVRDPRRLDCRGLGIGIVPVTIRLRGEFVTERHSPKYRWDSAKVHCYPRGARKPMLLFSGAASGTYTYVPSADVLYEVDPSFCFWRKKGGSSKDCKAFWRGTPPKSEDAPEPVEVEDATPEAEASPE